MDLGLLSCDASVAQQHILTSYDNDNHFKKLKTLPLKQKTDETEANFVTRNTETGNTGQSEVPGEFESKRRNVGRELSESSASMLPGSSLGQ